MIRLSAGTAACLGLNGAKMDYYPTTAYLLAGSRCLMNCSFCPQGTSHGHNPAGSRLGRISWPGYKWDKVKKVLTKARQQGVERICLQAVRHTDGIIKIQRHLAKIRSCSDLPISVSAWISSVDDAGELLDSGAERIAISIDVVNPDAFRIFKGGQQENRIRLLLRCAEKYPGKISTHLICGLGESEKEMLSIINSFVSAGITVGLFAFTPLKGTDLEKWVSPRIAVYRRVQIGYYLLNRGAASFDNFLFSGEKLISCGLTENHLKKTLADGLAFRTSGCPGCNRPYYNEHPGGDIYNYHYPPGNEQISAATKESGLLKQYSYSTPRAEVNKC